MGKASLEIKGCEKVEYSVKILSRRDGNSSHALTPKTSLRTLKE